MSRFEVGKSPYLSFGISSSALDEVYSNGSEAMTNVTGIDNFYTASTPPQPPTFQDSLVKTVLLILLFIISFIGNTATLIQMYRVRKRRSTINTLIVNLAVADLIVTFFCMAAEAIWALTVQWVAGIAMCKMLRFIQGTGLLLSTYITVVISLDRCCVIIDPISRNKAPQRVKIMIIMSWFLSALFSIPQVSPNSIMIFPSIYSISFQRLYVETLHIKKTTKFDRLQTHEDNN